MRAYKVVDVFTQTPCFGNPVAVVLDADGLDTAQMQRFASWTNLSETSFVLPPTLPGADYRLRIFTPRSELPFAGHPTLGSAHAVLEAGRVSARDGALVQECGVGLVQLSVRGASHTQSIAFRLPPAKVEELTKAQSDEVSAILRAPFVNAAAPLRIDVGPVWIVVQLPSAESVLALAPDFVRCAEFERRLGVTGITVFGQHASDPKAIEVRSFAPSSGMDEDPVCGSGNGSVAVFQHRRGLLAPEGARYLATQGRCVGRDGRVLVDVAADGSVQVGGSSVTCVEGALRI